MKAEKSKKVEKRQLTPPYARYLVHVIRPFPDFDASFIKPVRQKAVELLDLKEGDRVLDVGCGPGGSFPYLVHAVGPSGQVVGVTTWKVIAERGKMKEHKGRIRNQRGGEDECCRWWKCQRRSGGGWPSIGRCFVETKGLSL